MLFVFSILSGFLLYVLFAKFHFRFPDCTDASPFFAVLFVGLLTLLLRLLHDRIPFLFFAFHSAACFSCFPHSNTEPKPIPAQASKTEHQRILRSKLEELIVKYLESFCLPILSMLIGGAPLAMLTKLMTKKLPRENPLSDLIFLLPSRIGACFMLVVTSLQKYDLKNARLVYHRDRDKHPFRPLGHILSVYSGALHLCFPTCNGRLIGNMNRTIVSSDISILQNLIRYCSWFMILFGCFIRILLFP